MEGTRMLFNFSRVRWQAFHCVSAVALTINIYLLLRILSSEEIVLHSYSSKNYLSLTGFRGYKKQTHQPHPFAHLLSMQNLTERKKCTQPKLSLKNDALSFAFYTMKPLQCTGPNLFYMHQGYLVPNKTALGKRLVKSCQLSAIRRDTDRQSTEVDLKEISATKPERVNEDFLHVKCVFIGDDNFNQKTSQRQGGNLIVLVEEPVPLAKKSHIDNSGPVPLAKKSHIDNSGPVPLAKKSHIDNSGPVPLAKKSHIDNSGPVPLAKKSHIDNSGPVPLAKKSHIDNSGPVPLAEKSHIDNSGPVPLAKKSHIDYSGPVPLAEKSHFDNSGPVPLAEKSHIDNSGPVPLAEKSHIDQSRLGFRKTTSAVLWSGSSRYNKVMPQRSKRHLLHSTLTKQNSPNINKQIVGAFGQNNSLLRNIVTQSKVLVKYKTLAPLGNGLNKVKPLTLDSIKNTKLLIEPENERKFPVQEVASDPDVGPMVEKSEEDARPMKEYYNVENIEEWDELRQDMFYQELPFCEEEQLLVQVSPHKSVFERSRRAPRSKKGSGLNILMFGIDSMSSLTFKRKLPLTLNYLQKDLHAVVFDGYNIVGDGTTQAILPIFVGRLQHEVPDIHNKTLDGLNFVWNDFKRQGYATMFAEDEPHLGVFNLRLGGFDQIPTDHYMRYFWQAQRESHLRQACSEQYCTGPTPNHQFLFQYLDDFFLKYRNISRFAVGFSGELSHDEVNPSQYLDSDLLKFFRRLRRKGQLKDTAVIVFSDHGSRRGKVRRTLQGKIEERLPFLAIYLPEDFRKKHSDLYRNVVMNAARLTSPFDVHETLLDLLDLSRVSTSRRGISLLRAIPANRTCAEAGIETHWCTCVQEMPAPLSDPVVKGAVEAVVTTINKLTQPHRRDCVPLTFNVTHVAHLIVPNTKLLKFHKTEEDGRFTAFFGNATLDMIELQVTIETDRCHGVFEATVQARIQTGDDTTDPGVRDQQLVYHVDERDISRIDTYGGQSACVCKINPQIMKFCCCDGYLKGEKMRSC